MEGTIVGLDIGFAWVKGVANVLKQIKNGSPEYISTSILQPSVVGEVVPVFEESIQPSDIKYADSEHEYFAGQLATRHSQVQYATKKADKASTWTTQVLVKTALGMLAANQDINIVTSLPYDFYFTQKKDYKQMLEQLSGDEYSLKVGGKTCINNTVSIKNIKVIPQGYAAWMDYILDSDGAICADKKTDAVKENLIIDVGFNTLGLIDIDRMEINSRSQSQEDMGASKAYEIIQNYLKNKCGHAPTLYELDKYVLQGEYDSIDITQLTNKALCIYADLICNMIDNMHIKFNKYVLCGGWANQISKYMSAGIDAAKIVVLGQMANAQGNYKVGERVWAKRQG